ncbi:hypothetical protein AB0B21_33770 [Streptomyces rimosus]|uniref:hypothetical protein n=1 Tax=Streptomyces rimosus TaxID=1927 RepID=UPI00131D949F
MRRARHTMRGKTGALRGWRMTSGGAFWGGLIALMVWGTCIALLVLTATGKLSDPRS